MLTRPAIMRIKLGINPFTPKNILLSFLGLTESTVNLPGGYPPQRNSNVCLSLRTTAYHIERGREVCMYKNSHTGTFRTKEEERKFRAGLHSDLQI